MTWLIVADGIAVMLLVAFLVGRALRDRAAETEILVEADRNARERGADRPKEFSNSSNFWH